MTLSKHSLTLVSFALLLNYTGCSEDTTPGPSLNDGSICGPANCPSGCCKLGQCITMTTAQACGKGGFPCTECKSGQTCTDGFCSGGTSTGCDPAQCQTGCCKNDLCQQGTSDIACGAGGGTCSDCTLVSKTCDPVLKVCKETAPACGPGSGCAGCCQGSSCQKGTADAACGKAGNVCMDCTQHGMTCDPVGQVCQGTPTCDATSCGGCCEAGKCEAGNQDTTCGLGGNACEDCTEEAKTCDLSTYTCKGETPCGPGTGCAGCCSANGCVGGVDNTACGAGGIDCIDCTINSQICSPVNKACQNITTETLYKIILVSGELVAYPMVACTGEMTCDMWVHLYIGSQEATSTMKLDTNTPVWNEYMLTATDTEIMASFKAVVFDDDPGAFGDTVGTCNPSLTLSDLSQGTVVMDCPSTMTSGAKITFSFQSL